MGRSDLRPSPSPRNVPATNLEHLPPSHPVPSHPIPSCNPRFPVTASSQPRCHRRPPNVHAQARSQEEGATPVRDWPRESRNETPKGEGVSRPIPSRGWRAVNSAGAADPPRLARRRATCANGRAGHGDSQAIGQGRGEQRHCPSKPRSMQEAGEFRPRVTCGLPWAGGP